MLERTEQTQQTEPLTENQNSEPTQVTFSVNGKKFSFHTDLPPEYAFEIKSKLYSKFPSILKQISQSNKKDFGEFGALLITMYEIVEEEFYNKQKNELELYKEFDLQKAEIQKKIEFEFKKKEFALKKEIWELKNS